MDKKIGCVQHDCDECQQLRKRVAELESVEPVAQFIAIRHTPKGTKEFFGFMLSEEKLEPLAKLCTSPPKRDGWVRVPIELIDRFPEINMGNYSDDSVYELNNWGIEVVQSIQATPTD